MDNYFNKLNAINVNDKVEQKNGLTYLSWAYAWGEVKKLYPDANYKVCKFDGLPYVYDPQSGIMVYTEVTIEGITHEMWLPVMDGANKAQKFEEQTYKVWDKWEKQYVEKSIAPATMFDINKTIMRCLTKNLAMFGLGLYIYAGEDLPEEEAKAQKEEANTPQEAPQPPITPIAEETYWKLVKAFANGIPCPSGKTAREKFIELTNAREEHLAKFDHDVENVRLANAPQKKQRRKPASNETL